MQLNGHFIVYEFYERQLIKNGPFVKRDTVILNWLFIFYAGIIYSIYTVLTLFQPGFF